MYAIGVMSGTSLDGLDIVCIDLHVYEQQQSIQLIASKTVDYDVTFKNQLSEQCHNNSATLANITMMNAYLGKFIGEQVVQFLHENKISPQKVAFISSHGQTIFHEPLGGELEFEIPSTLQIGDISYISEVTRLPVVGDFRTGDMAAGGQGAPLLSYFDANFLHAADVGRAIQNIGGIGNVTYVPSDKQQAVISFDTGPGNVLIDSTIQKLTDGQKKFDHHGEMASEGNIYYEAIQEWMNHSYYSIPLPKTTGRELYTVSYVNDLIEKLHGASLEDMLATLTAYTVETIKHSYEKYLPLNQIDEIYINGGGSLNAFMMTLLAQAFPTKKVLPLEVLGVPAVWKEAIAFALFGYQTMLGLPNQLPSATGATREIVMGKVAYCDGNPYVRFEQLRGEM
ncbi:anhydro-N-acetylmuramic acid kinase [Solibacillus daqui]|uniref:anhydro-N-acetylmuramic acid kinase n=1 Tax=Solibacillus daqui TaxID=2912187 RepID=UPI0023669641|nr:anhydro-N-acetylmuramic acid kinase [Solibacillus daqui]